MAGYKTTVKNDDPISFHTFDLDSQALHGNLIIDEMNSNANPMYTSGLNYQLEHVSQNPLETSNQSSIFFAEDSKYNGVWSPVWCTILHSPDYNLSQWSFEFIVDKNNASLIRGVGEPGQYRNIYTPLIKKGSAINIYFAEPYSGGRDIVVSLFGGAQVLTARETTQHKIYNRASHVVITYGVTQIDVNEYGTAISVYINGRLHAQKEINYFDGPPHMIDAGNWFIMGDGGSDPVNDYITEPCAFDQFAIYDHPLSDEQISNHFRKTKTYENLIKMDYPSHYWRMKDTSTLNNTMLATVGRSGAYYGSCVKNQPAVEYIHDAKSVTFSNGGTAITNYKSGNSYVTMLNINADYTIEFWFKIGQQNKGLMYSCHEELYTYRGVTIHCNMHDGDETPGVIQVNEGNVHTISTPENRTFTDNQWHHFVFRRSGTTLKTTIDGELVAEKEEAEKLGTNGHPSQVHLMAIDPGFSYTTGSLSDVVMYAEALQDIQINSHYHFSTRYKIFGYTLLEGQGVRAIVRFYDDITGEKVGELESENNGEYTFYTYSNKMLDIVALLPENVTTRYRIHAPIVPSEFNDEHI